MRNEIIKERGDQIGHKNWASVAHYFMGHSQVADAPTHPIINQASVRQPEKDTGTGTDKEVERGNRVSQIRWYRVSQIRWSALFNLGLQMSADPMIRERC